MRPSLCVGVHFVYAATDGVFDHLQTRQIQLLDQAQGSRQQVSVPMRRSAVHASVMIEHRIRHHCRVVEP